VLASPSFDRLAIPDSCNEAESVHAFALRLTSLHQEASTSGSLLPLLHLRHGERALTMVNTFQSTRTTRLRLAHEGHEGNEDREKKGKVPFVWIRQIRGLNGRVPLLGKLSSGTRIDHT